MTELSVLELETEHAELLPQRETLIFNGIIGAHNHVSVDQHAFAAAGFGFHNTAIASNVSVIG
jgi:hypothetical protein